MRLLLFFTGAAALSLACLLPVAAFAQERSDDPLAAYLHKKRVLLVFAPAEEDAAYRRQRAFWKGEEVGFEERQLVVLPLLADSKSPTPQTLAKRFDIDPTSFRVILIGKDGHDAYRSDQPVVAQTVYTRIDAMPMRRAEMQRQKPQKPQK